jgi:hypothetical protein
MQLIILSFNAILYELFHQPYMKILKNPVFGAVTQKVNLFTHSQLKLVESVATEIVEHSKSNSNTV